MAKRPRRRGTRQHALWTSKRPNGETDDDILRRSWRRCGASELRRRLGKRTWLAIYYRAIKLGLPRYAPQGYESLCAAARRLGYARDQLAHLLRRVGVCTVRFPADKGLNAKSPVYVEIGDADEAVDFVTKTAETLVHASRRHRIDERTLIRELTAAGWVRPALRPKQHVYVESALIDRVMEAYRKTPRGKIGPARARAAELRKAALRAA
jgi:hypothetical protein